MAEAKKTIKKAKAIKKTAVTESTSTVAKAMADKEKSTEAQKKKTVVPVGNSVSSVSAALKINVLDTDGKTAGTMTLPEAIFGAKVNQVLMAQAVRVYLANQRQGNASTKTRGEVDGSTRKIYRQKGTGRARHGAVRAPIFVKGGIAHGPKPRDYSLSMPTKMKRAALFSALTVQLQNGNIIVVAGLEKLGAKTKPMAQALTKVVGGKAVVVMPGLVKEVYQAGRNIQGVTLTSAQELTSYVVLKAKKLLIMKDAVETLEKTFVK